MEHPFIGNAQNPAKVSRIIIILVLIRAIILIPQLIILTIWGFLAVIALFIMWIIAIFTARYPAGMYNFVLGFCQKELQVMLYVNGLTQKYPPFCLGPKEFSETNQAQQA